MGVYSCSRWRGWRRGETRGGALTMYASLIEQGFKLEREIKGKNGYVHVVLTSGYKEGSGEGAVVRRG